MIFHGEYRFYQNGELLATHKNILTDEGKRLILRYLAGQAAGLGEAIALGVGQTPASVSDSRLTFEVERAIVTLTNADYTGNKLVFKTTLEQELVLKIYESGLWSTTLNTSNTDNDSRLLTTFDTNTEEWNNVSLENTIARTSADAVTVAAAANATTSTRLDVEMDLSGYSNNDVFLLAFQKTSSNITDISLTFENETGNSFSLNKSITSLPVDYNVLSFRKGDFIANGPISWDFITKFGVDVKAGASGGNVVLDAIRIEDTDTVNPDHVLVSRSVLSTPLVKTSIAPMDIEYVLEIKFG